MTETSRAAREATVACPFCLTLNRVDMRRAADRPKCGECGKPILLDRPVKVTDETLERVVKGSTVPVVVDFYADWCQPCKMMAPALDQLAHDRVGEVLVAKLDTDASPAMAVKHGIRGIPTLIVFRDGTEARRQTGVVPLDRLRALVAEAEGL
ncbi:MAG TPA: thioredoxin [Longimicrobiales bacterium]|nr:thioredoxin [Longimicrobiales bacterium]